MNTLTTKTSAVKKSALVLGSTSKPILPGTRKKKYSSPITTAATVSSTVFNTNRHSMSISTSQAKESTKAAYKTAFVQKRSSLKKSMTSTAGSHNLKKSLNTTSGTVPYQEREEVLRSRNSREQRYKDPIATEEKAYHSGNHPQKLYDEQLSDDYVWYAAYDQDMDSNHFLSRFKEVPQKVVPIIIKGR